MYVLGINPSYDCSAALLKDGKLVFSTAEERLTRKKHQSGFPELSVQKALEIAGITINDVDHIAISWLPPGKHYGRMLVEGVRSGLYGGRIKYWAKRSYENSMSIATCDPKAVLRTKFGHTGINVEYMEHHMAHAASAYYPSGFDEAAIFTADWKGETVSSMYAKGEGGDIHVYHKVHMPHSIGYMYAAFTEFLGFEPNGGEGKTMGLAAYGEPTYPSSEFISQVSGLDYTLNLNNFYGEPPGESTLKAPTSKHAISVFGFPRKEGQEVNDRFKNIAFALQDTLETTMKALGGYLLNLSDTGNLAMAGGVALNCKMNGELLQMDEVANLYVQPAAADDGTALGAALQVAKLNGANVQKKIEHTYWGMEFSDDEIGTYLDDNKIKHQKEKDIAKTTAELLANGKIVEWFQGRAELGPRALGNRSILADPRDPDMRDRINSKVKFREDWRPLGPAILDKAIEDYLVGAYYSPHMTMTFNVMGKKRKEIPAVVHVDNTTRPQVLKEDVNPLFYKTLEAFGKKTGTPVLINTSFNQQGEPVVNSPEDAVKCFYSTGADALVMGPYLIVKS